MSVIAATSDTSPARALLEFLTTLGLSPETICTAANVDLTALRTHDRMPTQQMYRLWEVAAEKSPHGAIGIGTAANHWPRAAGFLGYFPRTARTIRDSLGFLGMYHRALCDGVQTRSTVLEDSMIAVEPVAIFEQLPPPPSRIEFGLAALTRAARYVLAQPEWAPTYVQLKSATGHDLQTTRTFFNCEIQVGANRNALVFPLSVLEIPCATYDPKLGAVLEKEMQQILAELPPMGDVIGAVRHRLMRSLRDGHASLHETARAMGMSDDQLSRALRGANARFETVLNDVRKSMAEHFVTQGVSVAEITWWLGFSDVTAFHRAFRRWTGQTPVAYRRAGSAQS